MTDTKRTILFNIIILLVMINMLVSCCIIATVSAEAEYNVYYVDNAGRVLFNETTSLDKLTGVEAKAGVEESYSVLNDYINLPFIKINLQTNDYYGDYDYRYFGMDTKLLSTLSSGSVTEYNKRYEQRLMDEYAYSTYFGYYFDYHLQITFFVPDLHFDTTAKQFNIKARIDDKIYDYSSTVESTSLTYSKSKYLDNLYMLCFDFYNFSNSMQEFEIIEINGITANNYAVNKDLSQITTADIINDKLIIRVNHELTPTFNIYYVDELGNTIFLDEKTSEIAPPQKEGYTASYTVLNKAPAIPFIKVDFTLERKQIEVPYIDNKTVKYEYFSNHMDYADELVYNMLAYGGDYETIVLHLSKIKETFGLADFYLAYKEIDDEYHHDYNIYFYTGRLPIIDGEHFFVEQLSHSGYDCCNVKILADGVEHDLSVIPENDTFIYRYSLAKSVTNVSEEEINKMYEMTYGGFILQSFVLKNIELSNSFEITSIGDINKKNFEVATFDSVEELATVNLQGFTHNNNVFIRINYEKITAPKPTTDDNTEPTADKPNAFVSFFKDNAKALTKQFMALGNGDFNTAFKSGWQIYCLLVACVAFILVLTLSFIALDNKIYKMRTKRKSKKIKE